MISSRLPNDLPTTPGLGVEPENLVLIQNNTGGTFGYKFSPTMEALVGAAALIHRSELVPAA